MMAHIEELIMLLAASAGIATHQLPTTSFWRQPKGMLLLVAVFLAGFLGWKYYEKVEADGKTEHEKWQFAENEEKLSGSHAGYCTYLAEYPNGEYFRQAEIKCHPQNSAPVAEAKPVEAAAIPAPVVAETTPSPAADVAAPASEPATPVEEWQTIDRYQVKDGLVKDTETSLMWMRCSLGQKWNGETCEGEPKEYNWNEAMKQEKTSHEGYSDWRVPTGHELKSLVYCSSGQPKTWNSDVTTGDDTCKGDYIKPTIKSDVFSNTPSSWFWSSSPHAGSSNDAWFVYFGNGGGDSLHKSYNIAVRLVRSGQ